MSMMISEVYEAFRVAGVPDDKARQAAEAVADINSRLASIETKISLIQWMVSGVGIGVLLLVLQTFLN